MKIFILLPLEFEKKPKKVVDYLKNHNFEAKKPPKYRRKTIFDNIVLFMFSSWLYCGYNDFF